MTGPGRQVKVRAPTEEEGYRKSSPGEVKPILADKSASGADPIAETSATIEFIQIQTLHPPKTDLLMMVRPAPDFTSPMIVRTRHLLHGRSVLSASHILLLCVGCTTVQSAGVPVSTYLYSSARLPCSFTFVQGPEGLTVVWEKVGNSGSKLLVHKFMDSEDLLGDQDPQFRERTELSGDFALGNLDLVLRNVTFEDEGAYVCKAAHTKGDGDVTLDLAINGLNVTKPTITFTYLSGDQYLLCLSSGVFRDLEVSWYDRRKRNLSGTAKSTISDLGEGRRMVESVLKMETEPNLDYFCQIREGRLNRSVRAVISDGNTPILLQDVQSSATWISAWKMIPGLLACTAFRIWIVQPLI